MNQKTICYANTIDYDFCLQQRPHHLMRYFSENGWKVYFINNTKRTDKVRERINDNLEVYHNWDVFCKRVPEVSVYFSSWSHRHVDLNQIKAKMVVYDSLDNFEANESEESNMIAKSDIVLTTSAPLYELRKNQHANVHLIRNGCFAELGLRNYSIPNDLLLLKANKKPIILFSGALSASWCDLELIEKVANVFQVVVVGAGWGLRKMPNGVHYLGSKKYDELQAYYHHCDVSILPFKRCQISDFSHPIKMMEAMSHGKPTVATDIPEATIYPGVVIPSNNHGNFISNIHYAIKLSQSSQFQQKARALASENTWEQKFRQIESVINQVGVLQQI